MLFFHARSNRLKPFHVSAMQQKPFFGALLPPFKLFGRSHTRWSPKIYAKVVTVYGNNTKIALYYLHLFFGIAETKFEDNQQKNW
ncbi:hypothetical protein C5S35_07170 [Candidatus Methanophagaceae archaeon]|nr:hypothetical protein C5S35_07170 [Methanophagales archaeon]